MIDETTQQPTKAGLEWLQQANVRLEDILVFDREDSMSPKRSYGKNLATLKARIMPTAETWIQRTLALLKIAAVIAREKFEKMYKIVHVG